MSVWQDKAAIRFPHSSRRMRIFGDGRFVLGIRCGKPKILLYPTREARQRKLEQLDRGCGYECRGEHDLMELSEE
jgi:hypothetical protein